jgi:hypothetical protein
MQPVFENRVAAAKPASAQLAQQHLRVPHARLQPLLDVWLERVQFCSAAPVAFLHRCPFRLQQILANRFAIESGELADRLHAEPLPLQLFDITHFFPP